MVASVPPGGVPAIVTHAASVIAGRPVVVSCIGNLGDGETASEFIELDSKLICLPLFRFLHGGRDGDAVSAVLTLTHEAEHAAGITDETAAECAAYSQAGRVVRLLGGRMTVDLRRTLYLAHELVRGFPGYHDRPCR